MARGVRTSDEKRAEAQSLLLSGQSVSEVARVTGLPKNTIMGIKEKISEEFVQVRTEKKQTYAESLVAHVQTLMTAMGTYATETSKPEYIQKQSAGDMATLVDTVGGYIFRLFDIASRVGVEAGGGPSPGATPAVSSLPPVVEPEPATRVDG